MRHILFLALGGVVGWAVVTLWAIAREPDHHPWPSVTRCPICKKRIYAWDGYERRSMKIKVEADRPVAIGISGSCLVHKRCEGTPESSVHVSVRTSP